MHKSDRPYRHLLWLRIVLNVLAITNIMVIFSTMPIVTHQEVDFGEFLDIHQLVLNIVVFVACMHVFWGCYRFPPLIRLASGYCLVIANLAYPIAIFVKVSLHSNAGIVSGGGGCKAYERMKTRCYMQYMIGSVSLVLAVMIGTEVALTWRMSRDREYLEMVERERQELELKEMQRRERAMMVHQYQPNLTLEDDDDDVMPRGRSMALEDDTREGDDVLPEYQQRETAIGLGRIIDMTHIVHGGAEEVCPHPYEEEEGDRGYMDPSPFSAEDSEAQAGRLMPGTGMRARTGTGTDEESHNSRLVESALSLAVAVPTGLPPIYAP
ncbi:hypothetical protein BGX33_011898 [Mortierella sp. NVP41]|nr:hypothetical protein BGX33_011898 [Mortierella sp. NVP41]